MIHNWQETYKEKLITAKQAADLVQNNDVICGNAREAQAILYELGKRTDIENITYYSSEGALNMVDSLGSRIHHYESFIGKDSRPYFDEGKGYFVPAEFMHWRKMMTKIFHARIAFACVSKPNDDGYVSFGNSTDCMPSVCREVPVSIAEINENLPFVYGSNLMHISEFDHIVEGRNYPLSIYKLDNGSDNESLYKAIGGYLSDLIEDEATLEIGFGRVNSAAMLHLEGVKHLGIHTEVYGELMLELTRRGIIDNSMKSENRGVSVCTQVVGSEELFKFVANNPSVCMDDVRYVNDPGVIARQRKMTALNNAVQIDLLGQGNAEYLKNRQYSGMGGINNYATGASICPDGKSIIVMESATSNLKYSKIVPIFEPGVPVSLGRTVIEYVVTEYGVATLVGKTAKERAKELIHVAHPKFREELTFKAREMGLL